MTPRISSFARLRTVPAAAALAAWVACFAPLLGCDKGDASSKASPVPVATAPTPKSGDVASAPLVLAPSDGLRWTQAPPGLTDATATVHEALTKAHADGRALLVYVGATWCEPCQRFHHAVEAGELDAAFPRLSILAFDADNDREALATAGYASRLIPLFAVPKSDGSSSGKQIEGSVKGESAVAEITPRLRELVTAGPEPPDRIGRGRPTTTDHIVTPKISRNRRHGSRAKSTSRRPARIDVVSPSPHGHQRPKAVSPPMGPPASRNWPGRSPPVRVARSRSS